MSQDSGKVIVPGHGRFWRGPVDSPAPGQVLKVTGAPTQAVLVLTVNAVASGNITLKSTDSVQAKLQALASGLASMSTVGAGKVAVLPGPDAWTFLIILDPEVTTPAITVTGTFTGGTTPAVSVLSTLAASRAADFTTLQEIGHTSQDSPLQINRSGGDVTTLDSWQANGIAQSTAAVNWALAYTLLQYDIDNMRLYYGADALQNAVTGSLQTAQGGGVATEHMLFLVVKDGGKALARHYPRVSTIAADSESFDTSKLAGMPIQSNLLSSNTLAFGMDLSPVGVAA